MPHLRSTAAALGAGVLLALAPAAAPAARVTPTIAPDQQQLFPGVARAHTAWASWQVQFSGRPYSGQFFERLSWPDATVWSVGARSGISAPDFGTYATVLDPWGGTIADRVLEPFATPGGDWLLSSSNREWVLRNGESWEETDTQQLVGRDSAGRVVSSRTFPDGRYGAVLVPGVHGPQVVSTSATDRPSTKVRLLDSRLRSTAVLRLDKPRAPRYWAAVTDAKPLSDGSVVVAVSRKASRNNDRTLLVRMEAGQRARTLWRGGQIDQLFRLDKGVVGITADGRVVAVDDRGRVKSRALGTRLPSRLSKCRWFTNWPSPGVVTTNGSLIIGTRCRNGTSGYAIELTASGAVRAAYELAPTEAAAAGTGARLAAADFPLPDGSLPFQDTYATPEETASGWSTWRPAGTAAPRRGTVKAFLATDATANTAARVQVTCRVPFGQICSGVAELRASGELVGSVRYSLQGRPGKLASTDRFDTTLSKPVAASELTVTKTALPARPLLNPAKPAWDASQPY